VIVAAVSYSFVPSIPRDDGNAMCFSDPQLQLNVAQSATGTAISFLLGSHGEKNKLDVISKDES
jgi:hypothetical protein